MPIQGDCVKFVLGRRVSNLLSGSSLNELSLPCEDSAATASRCQSARGIYHRQDNSYLNVRIRLCTRVSSLLVGMKASVNVARAQWRHDGTALVRCGTRQRNFGTLHVCRPSTGCSKGLKRHRRGMLRRRPILSLSDNARNLLPRAAQSQFYCWSVILAARSGLFFGIRTPACCRQTCLYSGAD